MGVTASLYQCHMLIHLFPGFNEKGYFYLTAKTNVEKTRELSAERISFISVVIALRALIKVSFMNQSIVTFPPRDGLVSKRRVFHRPQS